MTALSRDMEARLNMNETLEQVRTRFYELNEFTDSLSPEEKSATLERFNAELADHLGDLVGRSNEEWLYQM